MKNNIFSGRVIFDHLPKTAGMAVNNWLIENLGPGCVTPAIVGEHSDLIRRYGGQYSVISAHINFCDDRGIDPRYQYMTLLRDPVERVVSWLYYVVNNHDESQLGDLITKVNRFLDSDGQDVDDVLLKSISNIYVEHFCRIYGSGDDPLEKKMANSINAIHQYDVVGIYEDMPMFLAEVSALIGLSAPNSIALVNTTNLKPKIKQLSSNLVEKIKILNQLDLQFYKEIINWKSSANKHTTSKPALTTPWEKYEPKLNRVITTPDIIIAAAQLKEGSNVFFGQLITFDVDFYLAREIENLIMGIHIYDENRQWAFGVNSKLLKQSYSSVASGSYRVSHYLMARLPVGKYTAGFAFSEKLEDDYKELAWHDVLCEFNVFHHERDFFAGYCKLNAEITLSATNLAVPNITIVQPTGSLVVAQPIVDMIASKTETIEINVKNDSQQIWIGDCFRAVNLSYYWVKSCGTQIDSGGLRSPLPPDGIKPNQLVSTSMKVEAPHVVGTYTLVLTLVQEQVGWFEKMGAFEPTRITMEVKR